MAKIVLAIDGSEHSERAFKFYCEDVHKEANELILVHALEYPYIPGQPYVRHDVIKDLFDKARQEGAKIDEKFKALCLKNNVGYSLKTDFASAGDYVVQIAQDEKALMIVMGTRGMGTIRRTILGSVSDFVVHHAHCPVLIARN